MEKILEIVDDVTMSKRAERADAVGQMVRRIRESGDPGGVFQDLARALLRNTALETRRATVTMLAQALGADRARPKRYLRACSIVGEND